MDCYDSVKAEVLREWLKPIAGVNRPVTGRIFRPVAAKILVDSWMTVITSSSGVDVHALAWTGTMPLFPDGSVTYRPLKAEYLGQRRPT